MSYTFIHAADLHLDTPFSGVGQVAPRIQDALLEASLLAFDSLVNLAIREKARFVLLAGDLYDAQNRRIRAQHRFLKGLELLSSHGIVTLMIHGNHDPSAFEVSLGDLPPNVTRFEASHLGHHTLLHEGEPYATIYGTSFSKAQASENLGCQFKRHAIPGIHIGLLHCSVGPSNEHADYNPCSLEDLRAVGLDYWALGHIHKRQILSQDPWVVYPGNIQGRSSKPSEMGAKGAFVVTVDANRIREVRFEALDRVRFDSLELDLAEVSNLATLHSLLLEKASALQEGHEGRGLILRAKLTGRSPLSAELAQADKLEELLGSLRQESPTGSGFIWWDQLINQTASLLDKTQILRRRDFSAELLRLNEERFNDPERLKAFIKQQFEPLRTLKNLIPALGDTDEQQLLKEAEALALDLLELE